MVFHRCLRLSSLFFILFLSVLQTWFLLFYLHILILSSACSNLPVNPSSEFFHFSYCIFSTRIVWFLLSFSISISILFIYFFLSFSIYSYSSLSILRHLCKSLSRSAIRSFFRDCLLIYLLFTWMGHTCFFVCLTIFCCWKLDIWAY